jgi:hypothetical protein
MSATDSPARISRKIVVVFDICSSTKILEDLLRAENHQRWRNFLIRLKEYLVNCSQSDSFEIYKFLGDGYILLFDWDYPVDRIASFIISSWQAEGLQSIQCNSETQKCRRWVSYTLL